MQQVDQARRLTDFEELATEPKQPYPGSATGQGKAEAKREAEANSRRQSAWNGTVAEGA